MRLMLSTVLLSMVTACSDSDTDSFDGSGLVGTADGTDAFVAIVVGDEKATAYVCNGDQEITEYFWGSLDDSTSVELTIASGASLSAEIHGGLERVDDLRPIVGDERSVGAG